MICKEQGVRAKIPSCYWWQHGVCSRILWGSTNYFRSICVPSIKYIQNIIRKALESNVVASILDPNVTVTKGGEDTVWRTDFVNHMVQLQNSSIDKHKIWFSYKTLLQMNDYISKRNRSHWGTEKSSFQCRLATEWTKDQDMLCHTVKENNWSDIH